MRFMKMAFVLACSIPLAAQEEPRRIWDDYFGSSRPASSDPKAPAQPGPQYHPSTPVTKTAVGSKTPRLSGVALGVTVWKLDAPAPDDHARLLVQDGTSAAKQLTPHRMAAGEPLQAGDKVRLSIESSTSGYVYVIDQEMHTDGVLGAPYIIFPTELARGGNNAIRAGQLIEVPAQTDAINVFTLRPRTPGESGEKLTIILAPQPIAGLRISSKEQEISKETFDAWTQKWGTGSQQFELSGGKGRSWTVAEKEAGQDQSRLLTQEDPAPQTVMIFPPLTSKPAMASIVLQLKQ